jgi:predicted CopG family antitoxin
MKKKKYLQGVTFFVAPEMYEAIKQISDEREVSLSELLRELIKAHMESRISGERVNSGKGE